MEPRPNHRTNLASARPLAMDYFDPHGDDFHRDPHRAYQALRELAPITWWPAGEAWLLTRYQHVALVNNDPRFRAAPLPIKHNPHLTDTAWAKLRDGALFALKLDDELRLRRLVLPYFSPEKIHLIRSSIIAVVDRTLAKLPSRFDLIADYCDRVALNVMASLLGLSDNLAPALVRFTHAYRDVFARSENYSADEFYRRIAQLDIGLALFEKILAERRRAARREFLIDLVIDYQYQGDRLSDPELVSLLSFLAGPGLENISQLTATAIYRLAADKRSVRLLQKQPELWPSAIRETLRYDYFVKLGMPKYALEDSIIDGVTIAKGERVYAIAAAALRDPAVFREPERLDITRRADSRIAFARDDPTGLVKYLALQTAEIAAQRLWRTFPSLNALDLPTYDPEHRALRAITSLPLLAIR